MKIIWKLTQELGAEQIENLVPDFTAFDGDEPVGRVYQVEEGPARGTWAWEMTAPAPGLAPGQDIGFQTSGRAAERAEAGRRVLRAYQAFIRMRAAS